MPPCKKGTIASPLPKTNVPAHAKYKTILSNVPLDAAPCSPEIKKLGDAIMLRIEEFLIIFGGAL